MLSAGGPEVAARSTDDPAHTVLTRDHIGIAQSFMLTVNHGDDDKSGKPETRVKDVNGPAPVVTGENGTAIIRPFISNVGGPEGQGRQPQSVDGPMGTVIGENHRAVITPEAFVVTLTHQDAPGADPLSRVRGSAEPMPAVTGANRGELALVTPFAEALGGAVFAGKIVASVEMVKYTHNVLAMEPQNCLLITFVDGSRILLDIFFRMFKLRELARAQGFPESYAFKGSTSDGVKQVGNAVPVGIAQALCYEGLLQMNWGSA